MYRARVESVSGKKVFAGGNWLTCIGNKNVKAGDFVWTDGRCVYGNFLEAQTPIDITGDKKIIPVVTYSAKDTFSKKGYRVEFNFFLCTSFSTNRAYFEKKFTITTYSKKYSSGYLFSNNVNGQMVISPYHLNNSNNETVMALNIDAEGNIYQIIIRYNGSAIDNDSNRIISVIKNNIIVHSQKFYIGLYEDMVRACFIENEKNWYCIFYNLIDYHGYSGYQESESHYRGNYYLMTAQGTSTIINFGYDNYNKNVQPFISYQSISLPMHDEFYVNISQLIPKVEYFDSSSDADFFGFECTFDTTYEIFSKSTNKLIASFVKENFGCDISFIKLNNQQILLATNNNPHLRSYKKLYTYENKELTQIQEPNNFNTCINQCFRTIKKDNFHIDNIKFLNMDTSEIEIFNE